MLLADIVRGVLTAQGVYVLQSHVFPPLVPLSNAGDSAALLEAAKLVRSFPCLRVALSDHISTCSSLKQSFRVLWADWGCLPLSSRRLVVCHNVSLTMGDMGLLTAQVHSKSRRSSLSPLFLSLAGYKRRRVRLSRARPVEVVLVR